MKNHSDHDHENLCWIDIETTGLNPYLDAILEIGVIITTKQLAVVAEGSWVVNTSSQPGLKIRDIDPYVWDMHLSSGLWKESLTSELNLGQAANQAARLIIDNKAKGSPLCGSTISFDRNFLNKQAPELLHVLHYRNIDVSTLKGMFEIHYPHVAAFDKPPSMLRHRALDDLKSSLEEYRYYLKMLNPSRYNL